jgi:hypothetical protein
MIRISNSRLVDDGGRTLMLRGVNLGGSSKIPASPAGATHLCDDFFNYKNVSFVGRPFPLEEADEHFGRLRNWGFTFIRLIVTWEAIEHEGPGKYDGEFLEYLRSIVTKAGEFGFAVLIDPHQDVWSRWTGGDGAPGWTLENVGFNLQSVTETCASPEPRSSKDDSSELIWLTNATKLATSTMYTLFFGGNDFAPLTLIEGVPAQEFLQNSYINAMRQIAKALRGIDCVIGYEAMNEPHHGYIGFEDIARPMTAFNYFVSPSPFQSMLLGMGIYQKQESQLWRRKLFGSSPLDHEIAGTEAVRVWHNFYSCVWCENKVWDFDKKGNPHILRRRHFSEVNGRRVDFSSDYLLPFVKRFADGIREEVPGAIIFFEGEPAGDIFGLSEGELENCVFAPHWYDGLCLLKKRYWSFIGVDIDKKKLVIGKRRVKKSFAKQLKRFRALSDSWLDKKPVIIGEIGIPFDLNRGRAYRRGNFSKQIAAMDRSLSAADKSLLGYAIWNYTSDNDNEHGDHWNGEDLSIFSRDQQFDKNDINSGGRALAAVVRPYPVACAGEALRLSFDIKTRIFRFRFRHDPGSEAETEIFVPAYHFPEDYRVIVSDGSFRKEAAGQRLYYQHTQMREEHVIQIMPSSNSSSPEIS